MKVLITGSSGFIAHETIKKCQDKGWYVIGVDKRPIPEGHSQPDEFIQTDVMDLGFRDLMEVNYVIHLAWRANIGDCIRYPRESTYDNLNVTVHLIQVCKECNIEKFIFPSTASLYSHNTIPWNEDMKVEAIEPYSWQKLACETLCEMYSKQYGVPSVILRFFQVYGEFQRADTVISVFSRLIKAGKPLTLTKTKNPDVSKSGRRDFIYTGDLATAIVSAIESEYGKGEIFNVCTNKLTSIETIAETMGGEITWIPNREFDVDDHLGVNEKTKKLLNWKPEQDVLLWLKKQD